MGRCKTVGYCSKSLFGPSLPIKSGFTITMFREPLKSFDKMHQLKVIGT